MNYKRIITLYTLLFCFSCIAGAEPLRWRNFFGKQYTSTSTVKEFVLEQDIVVTKPVQSLSGPEDQSIAAARKSVRPNLRNIPDFPKKSLEPGNRWETYGTVIYDLSAFGFPRPVEVKTKVTYTYLKNITVAGRTYQHITAEWSPVYIPEKKLIRRSGVMRVAGYSVMDLLWDNFSGAPKQMRTTEEIQYSFSDGTYLVTRTETADDFRTVTDIIREETMYTLASEITNTNLQNLEIRQRDYGIVLSLANIPFELDSETNEYELTEAGEKTLTSLAPLFAKIYNRPLLFITNVANYTESTDPIVVRDALKKTWEIGRYLAFWEIIDPLLVTIADGDTVIRANLSKLPEEKWKNHLVEIIIDDEEVNE
ncbi:hypothetical protein K7I13_14120 [Brucepastera parasyntrophica]|uniref:hypothetical protein n=1 Tax=Brucepastera parasyntrophica TaxID=2880008 RepID=UPI00210ED61E|nr:hypothetical protein [Brucepastera parasyntrophica]ULQ59582.1 hypothetical protein K7I13_14120 [Brucepastera parasyntrophica]